MGSDWTMILMFSCLMLLACSFSSHPLCTNSRAPFTPKKPLTFCRYNGSVCCNSKEDLKLQNRFKSISVSGTCAPLLKSILCSRCDPFSAELYGIESEPRPVPILCNSTDSATSTQSVPAIDFCWRVWNECRNLSVSNTPFAAQGRNGKPINYTSKISDLWPSKCAFCDQFGGASNESVCFDGRPVSLNSSKVPSSSPSGVCLEKIGQGAYLNMAPHPDGSNRVFLSDQPGKIYLSTIPAQRSGEILGIDESRPFIDLTEEVHFDAEFGLMGIAFHPRFSDNGRFFVSFNCDKVKWPECSGRCSCSSDVGCDPARLPAGNGASPCQYHSVIAEFTANGTNVKPVETRRIFRMGLPFTSHHGGQILFGPEDGYLYFMMGDGGGKGDPYNFAQNKKSLLGKITRLDVNSVSDPKTISDLQLWGNYSVPTDNPFSEDKTLLPEIWAMGFRNPWRCSFDSERPSYFMCADVGQDQYEEVDIVTKGGNYGWRIYEGPSSGSSRNASASITNPIFPVIWYDHSDVNKADRSASITGGHFYRSMTDPCLYGRYLYADLYAGAIWAATETPANSGNFTSTEIPVSCALDSPISCNTGPETTPALDFIFSFGQDNKKDIYVLASTGLYRIVRPSRCDYKCPLENVTSFIPPPSGPPPPPPPPPVSTGRPLFSPWITLLMFFSLLFVLL